ncbi:RNA 2'-phosphotransferase [Paenibacillus amylolyticus]|uniref:Probable RNA 2'-phosphotransferase n=1 Tax=Paenibacillus amylolyticus TaxID=1451 RepID=A0A1R1BMP5_PAEAM|nr:RNA 2'-phosphotransferase [Paenibacillus amylolyticus]OMF11163.1 RNA 2'-phosphotransferase [Paenibacillus amylolyticus]
MKKQTEDVKLSKIMSKMLRHKPEESGLDLELTDGSCTIASFLKIIQSLPGWTGVKLTDIERVVRNSDKQRFEINNGRIRARYGHSYQKIEYNAGNPPDILYHGTNQQALPFIMTDGLDPVGRQYVHLSQSTDFAALAGSRRGELVILTIDTVKARAEGIPFYYAGNEVWLAEWIPWDLCMIK